MFDVLDYLAEEEKATTTPTSNVKPLSAPVDTTEGIRFEIDRGVLKVLLEKAVEVVPTKDILPVLKNFQIRVRGDKLSVVATNLNMAVVTSTAMSVETHNVGVEVFPARKLLEIVRESDAGSRVFISVNGRTAIIVAGSASWEISLGRGADFPKMPKVAAESLQKVDRAEFLRCLSTVKYAVGGEGRESLMMVNIKKGRFTACDGSRLQQARMPDFGNMQIPGFALDKLIKMLKGSDLQEMKVGETDNHLIFRVGADTLLVKKIAATFPPLEDLWLRPALSNDQKLVVEKTVLLDAIRQVKVNVDLEYSAISIKITPGKPGFKGELTIEASDRDGNSAKKTIPAQWEGRSRELVLHFRYLKEALSSYEPEDCLFKLGDDQKTKKSPVLLKDEDRNSLGIIQQMTGVPVGLRQGPSR